MNIKQIERLKRDFNSSGSLFWSPTEKCMQVVLTIGVAADGTTPIALLSDGFVSLLDAKPSDFVLGRRFPAVQNDYGLTVRMGLDQYGNELPDDLVLLNSKASDFIDADEDHAAIMATPWYLPSDTLGRNQPLRASILVSLSDLSRRVRYNDPSGLIDLDSALSLVSVEKVAEVLKRFDSRLGYYCA